MLHRSSGGLGVLHDPRAILLLQSVGNLHGGTLRRAILWPKLNLSLGLIPLNGKIKDAHVHGAKIYSLQGGQVLIDACSDSIRIAFLRLATREEGKKSDD